MERKICVMKESKEKQKYMPFYYMVTVDHRPQMDYKEG